MSTDAPDPLRTTRRVAIALDGLALAVVPINVVLYVRAATDERGGINSYDPFLCLAVVQALLGLVALIAGVVYWVRLARAQRPTGPGVLATMGAGAAIAGAVVGLFFGILGLAVTGASIH